MAGPIAGAIIGAAARATLRAALRNKLWRMRYRRVRMGYAGRNRGSAWTMHAGHRGTVIINRTGASAYYRPNIRHRSKRVARIKQPYWSGIHAGAGAGADAYMRRRRRRRRNRYFHRNKRR